MAYKNLKNILIMAGVITACICLTTIAQTNETTKIRVEIITEKDGEKQVLKKTYNSKAEMENDEEYQKFNSGNNSVNFNWNQNTNNGEETVTIVRDMRKSLANMDSMMVEVKSELGKTMAIVKGNEGLEKFIFNLDTDSFPDLIKFQGFPEELFVEMKKLEGDSILTKVITKTVRDFEHNLPKAMFFTDNDGESTKIVNRRFSRILIADLDPIADADYIKLNKYDPKKAPMVTDLTFKRSLDDEQNGSKRHLLTFKVQDELPLTVRLTSATGQTVYLEGLTVFKGLFERDITLEDESGEKFFLEITVGKNKLIKRIVIE